MYTRSIEVRIVPLLQGSAMPVPPRPVGWDLFVRINDAPARIPTFPGLVIAEAEFEGLQWAHITVTIWAQIIEVLEIAAGNVRASQKMHDVLHRMVPSVAVDSVRADASRSGHRVTYDYTWGYHNYNSPLDSSKASGHAWR